MKFDVGSASVGGNAGFEAVIGARNVKWYKGHYLKLNALLVSRVDDRRDVHVGLGADPLSSC